MRSPDFDYRLGESLEDASTELAQNEGAVALAGGQSLIPLLRLRLARPSLVVDIGRIPGLADITQANGVLSIGALAATAAVASSELVRRASPLWADAASVIADPLIRNAGTVGGNLAHADPLNDLPAALVATCGHVTVVGPGGERSVAADDLFAGPFSTTLDRGELITGVALPTSPGGAYEKLKRAAVDYGVAAVAVQLGLDGDGLIEEAGIAVTGTLEVAPRAGEAEEALVGSSGGTADVDRAAAAAARAAALPDDERGSARYKAAVIEASARRAIQKALDRAGGSQ